MLDQVTLDTLWDFSDPAESEARFRVELVDGAWDSDERAELETQLARAIGLQSRFDEARGILDRVDAAEGSIAAVRVVLERGRVLTSSDRAEDAVPLFAEAVALAGEAGSDFLLVDALHMLGIADDVNADHWTAEAIAVANASGDDRTRRWLVSLHNNLGWHYFDDEDFDAALAQFTEAARWARLVGTAKQREWAAEAIEECRAEIDAR